MRGWKPNLLSGSTSQGIIKKGNVSVVKWMTRGRDFYTVAMITPLERNAGKAQGSYITKISCLLDQIYCTFISVIRYEYQ